VSKNDVFVHIDTGVILIGDIKTTDHCLIIGFQVRGWIVGK